MTKTTKALTCKEVADYFLVLINREAGDLITQLKLQKLVYFAQGISLALLGKSLFDDEIEAWKHGPVIRSLRIAFGSYEKNAIPSPAEMDFDAYNQEQKELIFKTYSKYGEYSAEHLANLTHEHEIWKRAFSDESSHVISKEKITEFFKNKVNFEDDFLSTSEKDKQRIIIAEDEWWMNYDSGIPAEESIM